MTPSIGTGVRLLYGNYGPDDLGWEVGYVGIYGMYANPQIANAGGSLQAPGDLGSLPASGLNDASLADAMYSSSIQSAEVNVVSHTYDGGYNRSSKAPWQRCRGYDAGHVDWLAGFRWAGGAAMGARRMDEAGNRTDIPVPVAIILQSARARRSISNFAEHAAARHGHDR